MSITYEVRDSAAYSSHVYRRMDGDGEPVMVCAYLRENGRSPCCTHDCNGCMWYEEQEDYCSDE